MKYLKNEKGFSLLEVMMAGAIFGILMMAILAAIDFLGTNQQRTRHLTAEDRTVSSLINNIRANLHLYQVVYDPYRPEGPNEKRDELLDELPLAFNANEIVPKDDCKACPGRLGVVIQPVRGVSGLNMVSIRIEHEILYPDGAKEFRFLASHK